MHFVVSSLKFVYFQNFATILHNRKLILLKNVFECKPEKSFQLLILYGKQILENKCHEILRSDVFLKLFLILLQYIFVSQRIKSWSKSI